MWHVHLVHGCVHRAPKPGAEASEGSGLDAAALGRKIFVKFETVEAATACAHELHGKQFDGRAVVAAFASAAALEAVLAFPCHVPKG